MKIGTRVKKADANDDSIPAYRDLRGTVVGKTDLRGGFVLVQWDCDPPGQWDGWPRPDCGPTPVRAEDLKEVE